MSVPESGVPETGVAAPTVGPSGVAPSSAISTDRGVPRQWGPPLHLRMPPVWVNTPKP